MKRFLSSLVLCAYVFAGSHASAEEAKMTASADELVTKTGWIERFIPGMICAAEVKDPVDTPENQVKRAGNCGVCCQFKGVPLGNFETPNPDFTRCVTLCLTLSPKID